MDRCNAVDHSDHRVRGHSLQLGKAFVIYEISRSWGSMFVVGTRISIVWRLEFEISGQLGLTGALGVLMIPRSSISKSRVSSIKMFV